MNVKNDNKKYRLVELTPDEKQGLNRKELEDLSCSKCVAGKDDDLCDTMPRCMGSTFYFVKVEKENN